jgi:hypothetical protein
VGKESTDVMEMRCQVCDVTYSLPREVTDGL